MKLSHRWLIVFPGVPVLFAGLAIVFTRSPETSPATLTVPAIEPALTNSTLASAADEAEPISCADRGSYILASHPNQGVVTKMLTLFGSDGDSTRHSDEQAQSSEPLQPEFPELDETTSPSLTSPQSPIASPSIRETSMLPSDSDERVLEILEKRVSLDLRDATLQQAMFSLRDACGLNIVIGNEVSGTVNASYTNSTVSQVLDTLLLPRGYSYRVVSGSVAVMPLQSVGNRLATFKTEVVKLRYVSPDDMLSSVEALLSPEGTVVPVPSSHSLLLMDYPERLSEARLHIEQLDSAPKVGLTSPVAVLPAPNSNEIVVPQSSGLSVRVFQPQYVTADILIPAITPLLSAQGTAAALEMEDKIVVRDTLAAIADVATALQSLDQPRPQVRIEALIYDCSLEDSEAIGINLRAGGNGNVVDPVTGVAVDRVMLNTVTGTVSGPTNAVLTMSTLADNMQFESIIQALRASSDSRLLADPNVVVMNHEPAKISIVTEVPYQQLTQGLQGGTIGTTEFREAGVTLSVTPHISADDTVSMMVNPQFSLLTGFTPNDNAPIIDRRETTTTVRVRNGHTLVLGGLRQRTRIVEQKKIPLLGDLRWVGPLFRHKSDSAVESELLVFIRPQIITPDYSGEPREIMHHQMLDCEIEQTPTDPIPYGFETIQAEDKARRQADRGCNQSAEQCQLVDPPCTSFVPPQQRVVPNQPIEFIGPIESPDSGNPTPAISTGTQNLSGEDVYPLPTQN